MGNIKTWFDNRPTEFRIQMRDCYLPQCKYLGNIKEEDLQGCPILVRQYLEYVIKEDAILRRNISNIEEHIERLKTDITNAKVNISHNKEGIMSAFGLKSGDRVKLTQYEHFKCSSAYYVFFEQEVEIKSMNVDCGRFIAMVSRVGRKTERYYGAFDSFAIHTLDGREIINRKLEHDRTPEVVSEEMKKRCLESQKL